MTRNVKEKDMCRNIAQWFSSAIYMYKYLQRDEIVRFVPFKTSYVHGSVQQLQNFRINVVVQTLFVASGKFSNDLVHLFELEVRV